MGVTQAHWPYVINLGNSIIGVSVLAMPFCMKQCGVILGMLLLLGAAFLTNISCNLLMKSAITSKKRSFEFLAFHTFGPVGKLAVEISIIGMLLGTCIAFHVIIGDVGPAILSKVTGLSNTENLRTFLMVFLGLFVAMPLGLLKSIDSLSNVSAISIGFYAVFVAEVFSTSFPNLWSGVWVTKVSFWNPEGVFKCLPIFSLAFGCQTQLFVMYDALPEPSLKQMTSITKDAISLCTVVYLAVGYFGYVAFCDTEIQGDVLMNFKPTIFSEAIKFGFVLSVAISFPLVIFPCRASLYTLLFAKAQSPHENFGGGGIYMPDLHFKVITVLIVVMTLIAGIFLPNIEFILGITGATMGAMICFIFPAVMYISVNSLSKSSGKSMAQVVLFLGVTILLASTYVTLYSQDQAVARDSLKIEPPIKGPEIEQNNPIGLDKPKPQEDNKDKEKKPGDESLPIKEKPPDKESRPEDEKSPKDKNDPAQSIQKAEEVEDEKRQEPPIPHAPDEPDKGEEAPVKVEEKKEEEKKEESNKDEKPAESVDRDKKDVEKVAEAEKVPVTQAPMEKPKTEDATKKPEQEKEDVQREAKQLLSELKQQHEAQKELLQQQQKIIDELKQHQKEAHEGGPAGNDQAAPAAQENIPAQNVDPRQQQLVGNPALQAVNAQQNVPPQNSNLAMPENAAAQPQLVLQQQQGQMQHLQGPAGNVQNAAPQAAGQLAGNPQIQQQPAANPQILQQQAGQSAGNSQILQQPAGQLAANQQPAGPAAGVNVQQPGLQPALPPGVKGHQQPGQPGISPQPQIQQQPAQQALPLQNQQPGRLPVGPPGGAQQQQVGGHGLDSLANMQPQIQPQNAAAHSNLQEKRVIVNAVEQQKPDLQAAQNVQPIGKGPVPVQQNLNIAKEQSVLNKQHINRDSQVQTESKPSLLKNLLSPQAQGQPVQVQGQPLNQGAGQGQILGQGQAQGQLQGHAAAQEKIVNMKQQGQPPVQVNQGGPNKRDGEMK